MNQDNNNSSNQTVGPKHHWYLALMETLGVIILAAMLAVMLYGGIKIAHEAKTISGKVNNFNSQVNQINSNLKNINNQLQASKPVIP